MCERCDKYNLTIKELNQNKFSIVEAKEAFQHQVRPVERKWKAHKKCADKAYTFPMDKSKKAGEYLNLN